MKVIPAYEQPRKKRPKRSRADNKPVSKQSPTREKRITKKQQDIYLNAARLFITKGFAETSMSDLAEAVNFTKAGLYHSISSKEDLLYTLILNAMDDFDQQVLFPATDIADPYSRLKVAIRLHVANVTKVESDFGNPMTRIVDQVSGLSPERQKIVAARKRRYFELMSGTLDELQEKGLTYANLDTKVAALSLTMMILGVNMWKKPKGRLTSEDVSRQVTEMALRSVLMNPQ